MSTIGPSALRALPLLSGMLWGAALCAGAQAPASAQRAPVQTAMSVPRPAGGGPTALPRVLAPSDAVRMRRVFELQAAGDREAAERETDRLNDRRLIGHVLADRWNRPGPVPDIVALQSWLADYADHPDAAWVHTLLTKAAPPGASLPPVPAGERLEADEPPPEERDLTMPSVVRSAALDRTIRERARDGQADAVLAVLGRTRGLTPAYASLLQGDAAIALFQGGRDEAALRLATEALRAQPANARAAFAAGLAAWGLSRYDAAFAAFEQAARTDSAAPALRSAAAFWTARAAVRAHRPALYVPWMTQAAQETRTFYGLVARRALGLPTNFAWEGDLVGEAEAAALAETAGGWRALALLQIGQSGRAESELRQLWARARRNPALVRAMLFVAQEAQLTRFSAQLGSASQSEDGRPRDYARFPVPRLLPQGGYRVDPALLYALALQESRFYAGAVSPAGARGLMQIMPATASYVANDPGLRGERIQRLHDPAFSLELGQRYVHYLARHEAIDGNLIRLLAAYNAGPGNLQKWLPVARHRDDPFLFIEAIPLDETRDYVRRVLAYSWIYASRLGLPAPSLDTIAGGGFPRFAGTDEVAAMLLARTKRLH